MLAGFCTYTSRDLTSAGEQNEATGGNEVASAVEGREPPFLITDKSFVLGDCGRTESGPSGDPGVGTDRFLELELKPWSDLPGETGVAGCCLGNLSAER